MTRQSLRQHAAFVLLDNISDDPDIGQITDRLIAIGYIEDNPEDYRRLQVEDARRAVREHRKSKARTGEIQLELVSLQGIDKEGNKRDYFKPCGRLSPKEAAQHLRYWNEKIEEDTAQFARYYEFHHSRHGRKLQKFIDFPLPIDA